MHLAGNWQTLALLGACVIAAMFTPPRRSLDQQVRQRVLERLRADPATTMLPIDVAISGGVATVSGQFTSTVEHTDTLTVVAHTDGVMDVIDELTISDRVITEKVLNALHADAALTQIPVTVTTVDGEVTLRSDQTNDAQRRQLVRIAASVDGVVHVVDAMK